MSDVEIRINKRTIERGLYLIIIIALAVFLYIKWDGTAAPDNTEELSACHTNITTLTNNLNQCNEELSSTKNNLTACEAAIEDTTTETTTDTTTDTTTTETDSGLSGNIDVSWDVDVNSDDKVTLIKLTVENGMDTSEEVNWHIYWEELGDKSLVKIQDGAVVRSGETETYTYVPRDVGFLSSGETLVVEFTNGNDRIIDRFEEPVA